MSKWQAHDVLLEKTSDQQAWKDFKIQFPDPIVLEKESTQHGILLHLSCNKCGEKFHRLNHSKGNSGMRFCSNNCKARYILDIRHYREDGWYETTYETCLNELDGPMSAKEFTSSPEDSSSSPQDQ